MRGLCLVTLFAAVLGGSVAPAQQITAANDAEATYLRYLEASKNKDTGALSALIADDYSTLNGRGKLTTKADEISEVKSGPAFDSLTVTQLHSHIVGDTAVISCSLAITAHQNGSDLNVNARELAVLLKRNGRWQLVADESATMR